MPDLLAVGEEWFESKRSAYASIDALYHPKDEPGITYPCAVTLVVGKWDMIDTQQQIVRIESKDFYVSVKDYAPSPKAGDHITYAENGIEKSYEVTIPRGRDQCWNWANRSETLRKVHTFLRAGPVPDTSALLVRAAGVSAAPFITDAEIKSSLTIDMATSRRMGRTLAPSAQYIYIVMPESFGVPSITVNGLAVTAWETTVRSIQFDGQAPRAYRVLRSTYSVTAFVRIEVA